MTTRLQVTFPVEDHRAARRRASEQGISLAEYVRRLIHEDLSSGPPKPKADISEIFGLANSGGSNIAMHKDEYIAEAIETHLEQRRLR